MCVYLFSIRKYFKRLKRLNYQTICHACAIYIIKARIDQCGQSFFVLEIHVKVKKTKGI